MAEKVVKAAEERQQKPDRERTSKEAFKAALEMHGESLRSSSSPSGSQGPAVPGGSDHRDRGRPRSSSNEQRDKRERRASHSMSEHHRWKPTDEDLKREEKRQGQRPQKNEHRKREEARGRQAAAGGGGAGPKGKNPRTNHKRQAQAIGQRIIQDASDRWKIHQCD